MLLSCRVCHPSLANDNLSGFALATFLAKHLTDRPTRYTYRFVIVPATIGVLTWRSRTENHLLTIKHGLVRTCTKRKTGSIAQSVWLQPEDIASVVTHALSLPRTAEVTASTYGRHRSRILS